MKVATYNVNSIRSRLHIVIPWIEENSPDILCLQETKVENRKFPESEFHRIGYHVIFYGGKGRNGVAIVSKHEPENVSFGFDSEPKDPDRLIKAEILGIKVVNTYVPQGYRIDSPKFKYKIEWLRRLKDYFKKFDFDDYILWCGDMNVAPTPLDVYDPIKMRNHVCFHEIVRREFAKIVELGFVDLLRKHHPNERVYTYYDYRIKNSVEKNIGWRIDAILASKPLADKSRDCYVDLKPRLAKRPSDHTIIVAEFDF